MDRKIFKTGHSLAVTLSKKILNELGLKEGDAVSVEADKAASKIIIKQEQKHAQLSLNLHLRQKLGVLPPGGKK
ncbi:MAG: AbrB/MazE/SpoVT family DNA-binding domain-containing protein [Patescibacteria group bacterium]|nr:AbrB/MazE/SpoVT family DNA-binding domain-containing protein [Patescibacteria group bacterium]